MRSTCSDYLYWSLYAILTESLYAPPVMSHLCCMSRLAPRLTADLFSSSVLSVTLYAFPRLSHACYMPRLSHPHKIYTYIPTSIVGFEVGASILQLKLVRFVWAQENRGRDLFVPLVKAFGWHQHPDNILSKQTASTNRERCDKSICSNKAKERDVSGVASQTSCLFWLWVTIFHSKPIFRREEMEEGEGVGVVMPAITVLPVRLTFVTRNKTSHMQTALCFVSLFISRKWRNKKVLLMAKWKTTESVRSST